MKLNISGQTSHVCGGLAGFRASVSKHATVIPRNLVMAAKKAPSKPEKVAGLSETASATVELDVAAQDDAFGDDVLEALKKLQGGNGRKARKAKAKPVLTPAGTPRVEIITGGTEAEEEEGEDAAIEGGDLLEDGELLEYGFDEGGEPMPRAEAGGAGEEGEEEDFFEDDKDQGRWADEEPSSSSSGKPRNNTSTEVRAFDTARVFVQGGDGGNGCVAFRREKFIPRGGPSGGGGGRGGNVWAVADSSLNSLTYFRRQIHFRAKPGYPGTGSNCQGADGGDTEVRVPRGTIIRRRGAADDEPPVAELLEDGERALLAVGGRGGRGNSSFKTSLNRAPILAERGEKGRQYWLDLELKIVADVGIVGVPNAGKSTLLSVVSAARPKIANYPFTTLVPNLGVCEMDMQSTVFADVPGLLEGAHMGKGLGQEFLRHCERCRVLVHLIDGTSPDPIHDFNAINNELELFSPELADKPQIVAYNKVDLPDSNDYFDLICEHFRARGLEEPIAVSAATGRGVVDLVRRVRSVLDALPPQDVMRTAQNITEKPKRHSAARLDDFVVEPDFTNGQRTYVVHGEGLERFSQMTNFDFYESAKRFQQVLKAAGVLTALRQAGVHEGDTVVIGEMEMEWSDDTSERAMFDRWIKARGKAPTTGTHAWPTPYRNI